MGCASKGRRPRQWAGVFVGPAPEKKIPTEAIGFQIQGGNDSSGKLSPVGIYMYLSKKIHNSPHSIIPTFP
jgi:hypothetical protein